MASTSDLDIRSIRSGAVSGRDTAGFGGRLFYSTDAGAEKLERDSGSAWVVMTFSQHTSTKVGFFSVTPVVRASAITQTYSTTSRTHAAYTADPESGAYTGAADGEAKLVDLNALRVAYENLRVAYESTSQLLNAVVDDLQAYGLEQ
jgi:hypothetical protein